MTEFLDWPSVKTIQEGMQKALRHETNSSVFHVTDLGGDYRFFPQSETWCKTNAKRTAQEVVQSSDYPIASSEKLSIEAWYEGNHTQFKDAEGNIIREYGFRLGPQRVTNEIEMIELGYEMATHKPISLKMLSDLIHWAELGMKAHSKLKTVRKWTVATDEEKHKLFDSMLATKETFKTWLLRKR